MTIGLTYNGDLSRVQIALSDLPDGLWRIERSINQLFWETVRGGSALPVSGGVAALDDYEFAADVENFYRAVPIELENLMEVFTSSGTWSKPTGLVAVRVRVVGGGGAGGGAAVTAAGEVSGGSGGTAGVYAESVIAAASLGSTETVTVGAAGVAVAGGNGGSGGTSSFGAHVSGNGGNGGVANTAGALGTGRTQRPGAATSVGTGQIVAGGQAGHPPVLENVAGTSSANTGGTGGASVFGGGGRGDLNTTGQDAVGYGGGGGGTANSESQGTARAGGDGAAGVVIVENIFWPAEA